MTPQTKPKFQTQTVKPVEKTDTTVVPNKEQTLEKIAQDCVVRSKQYADQSLAPEGE